ncbi:hypothetical protein BDZ97DRAFT_1813199 [Flammula alnicola]|nr:hypothetical protein BDZ97DRAFT_1813199 [Flammula alnicola]
MNMNIDVLSQIFEIVVDENPSSLSIIRSVNRDWFEIAGNTPKLWSKFHLDRKIRFVDPEYSRLHIQKSGGIPLEITISLPKKLRYNTNFPVIVELRQAVHRIKSLSIDAPFLEAWQHFVSGIGDGQPAPILERLIIRAKGDVNNIRNNGPFKTLSTALTPSPNLIHLQLPAWPFPSPVSPQFSTIRSLVFETPFSEIAVPDLFPIIKATPYLQHFRFKGPDYGNHFDPNYSNIISAPHLRTVDVTSPGIGLNFLGNFRAPFLAEVRLDGYREVVPLSAWELDDWGIDATRPQSNILTYLSTHSPDIRRLELKYIHFEHPKEDHNRILSGQAFPFLEELILERTNIPDISLIESAGRHSGLKKLELRNCKYISVEGLRSFVQGHSNAEFVLKVEDCRAISREDFESLTTIPSVGSP